MKISVFGLGYVGVVSAGCLAKNNHQIVGVDPNILKVEMINAGGSPIIEKNIDEIILKGVEDGNLRATDDHFLAVHNTDLSFVCVGTPSDINGGLDLSYVKRVCVNIGKALKEKDGFHVVVIRSTILPGTMNKLVVPELGKHSGKKVGEHFGVCNNPEFLREGTSVYDFYHPPKIVIGESDRKSGDILAKIYESINAPMIRTHYTTAEMVKYVDNVWHGLKVGFGNEIGNLSKALGIDGHEVMDIFCMDNKLNISATYLKPGFAFGGSCLPKDLRALTYTGKHMDLELPILNAILPSNNLQIERGIQMVIHCGKKKIGFLGFSFKAGTDDLRESPVVEMIERLIGKGYDLCLYDKNVKLAKLMGANRDYILNHIPHIANLMVSSIEEVLNHSETIVVGNSDPEFETILNKVNNSQAVVDLVRIGQFRSEDGNYNGICW